MNRHLAVATFLMSHLSALPQSSPEVSDATFSVQVVASGLSDPWEITYGPDNFLWVTESKGYRVLKIDPSNGERKVLADLNAERQFPRYDRVPDDQDGGKPWPAGGLMGMVLHPLLLKGKPYVYLSYVYRYEGSTAKGDGKSGNEGYHFRLRIARYVYDTAANTLTEPVSICDTVPASNDHNGARLLITAVNGKPYLFMSVGDMGAGQFTNGGRTNKAQNTASYEGKILRFNLEPDKDRVAGDSWVPDDNPFNGKHQSAVWTTGHRNPQGLTAAIIDGHQIMYSTEHGPYSDDEVNIIERGCNYGHPLVIGYNDGNYDGLAASVSDNSEYPGQWRTSYPFIRSEKENAIRIGTYYRNPILSFYPTGKEVLFKLFTGIKSGKEGSWQSFAPSGAEVYVSDAIPGWKNSLLIPTLKGARLLRLKLDEHGKITDTIPYEYAKGEVRYRDVAVSPDGLTIYMATDSAAVSSGPSKENPGKVSYRGSILAFRYQGVAKDAIRNEMLPSP